MKRKIKFRGQRVDNGEWIYGDYHHRAGGVECIIRMEPDDNGKAVYIVHQVDPDTIGQFTGLLDNNGKEIYEGDIMNNPTSKCVGVVEWNSILCQFQLSWQNMHTAADIFFMVKCSSFVIGNIHDNPEMLHTKSE